MDEQQKAETKSDAAPYIMKTVAVGLQLDDGEATAAAAAAATVAKGARRQSLTQRLGLQSLGKRKETEENTAEYAGSSSASEQPEERHSSSLPVEQRMDISDAPGTKAAKVECVEIAGEDLYVGTSTGHIVHYTVATGDVEACEAPERLRVSSVDVGLGGKKVDQLLAFPALSKLVVLSGSTVVFYSVPELRRITSSAMPAIKGVSCIAYDERIARNTAAGAVLCVARMRSVHIYRLSASELRLEQEVAIGSSVASICQYGNYVCLADSETYKILDLPALRTAADGAGQLELLPTQQPSKDPETGRIIRPPRPRTLVVGPNEFMFLTSSGDKDTLGVIVTAMGEALRGTLQFASYPKSIAYDDPYVIAVFGSGQVEVFDTRKHDQTLVQSFFAAVEEPAGRPRRICVAAGFHVSTSVSRPEVLDVQEGSGQSEGAATAAATAAAANQPLIDAADLFGAGISPEDAAQRAGRDLDTKPWTSLVSQNWRREPLGDNNPMAAENRAGRALSRFTAARTVVVTQDAALHALVHRPQLATVDQLLHERRIEEAMAIVERALAADPTLSARNDEVAYCFQMAGSVCLKNMLLDDALHFFQRGSLDPRALIHLFPDIAEYLGSLLVPFARIPMASGLRRLFYDISDIQKLVYAGAEQLAGDDGDQVAALRATLGANVLEMAQRYLEHCRTQMLRGVADQHSFAPDAFPVIDTALVRLYVANKEDRKLRKLIASKDNGIVSDLACQHLMDTHNYYHCSLLYRAQGNEAAKVLDIWHRLLQPGDWEDARFGGLPEYLDYVQTIDDQPALLDEYYWLVDHDYIDASLQLLACLSDETVLSIDADRVVQRTETATNDQPLRILIERLIAATHPRAKHYMTYLVYAYVRQIRDHYNDSSTADSSAERDAFACAQADDLTLTYRAFLSSRDTEGARLHVQLVNTLCVSPPTYDARLALEYIEAQANDLMVLERAVILIVQDQIDSAVDLLVNELGDFAEAELLLLAPEMPGSLARLSTTSSHEVASAERKKGVLKLMAMYLELARKGHDEIAARLVARLLDQYFVYLDASVLEGIPDHWPYAVVAEPFVLRSLQLAKRNERRASVVRGLHESLAFASKAELAAETKENGAIVLDYSQTCAKCKKLLGSSAFVFEPDTEQVKHISCS